MSIQDLAVMPLSDYQAACDAIRLKSGTQADITSGEMASKISALSVGVDVSATTATANKVLKDYVFYTSNGTRTTGTIQSLAATNYYPSTSDQTIASGKYLSGNQKIKKLKMTNLTAGNIKAGVVVKIGDDDDDDRVTSITGTYSASTYHTASGSFTGDNSSSITVTVSGVTSSNTLLAWGVSGTPNQDKFYMGYGNSGTGNGVYAKTLESNGWVVGSISPTCSLGSGRAYFGSTSSCSFNNGTTYYWWIVYA